MSVNSSSNVSYNYKRANFDALLDYYFSMNWLRLFASVPPNNVEHVWLLFKSVIYADIDKFVPRSMKHTLCIASRRYPPYIKRALKVKLRLWRARHEEG
jgi:hypothetical protein